MEAAVKVRPDDAVPLRQRDVENRVPRHHAGVIDQDVNAAEALQSVGHQTLGLRVDPDVAPDGLSVTPSSRMRRTTSAAASARSR